jgi:hypothetical protein
VGPTGSSLPFQNHLFSEHTRPMSSAFNQKGSTMTTRADRSAISRAVAKAIAYHDCGKPEKAAAWAAELVRLLGAQGILAADWQHRRPE